MNEPAVDALGPHDVDVRLAVFNRKVWALGSAGVEVPLTLYRDGLTFEVWVNSSERAKFLKAPRMH
jgi:hypothetical protein